MIKYNVNYKQTSLNDTRQNNSFTNEEQAKEFSKKVIDPIIATNAIKECLQCGSLCVEPNGLCQECGYEEKTESTRDQKIEALRSLMTAQTKDFYIKEYGSAVPHLKQCEARIKPGKKYTKIDRGTSGVYMIDGEGNIFGIKAYGVIHRGYHFGTLDTIHQYNWGGYRARKVMQ